MDEACSFRRGARGTERKRRGTAEPEFELTSEAEERSENTLKFMRRLESSNEASLLVWKGKTQMSKFPQCRAR